MAFVSAMAHSCPTCGQVCYCGGDLDDILLEDTEEEEQCGRCSDKDRGE
jgi:hypothetical protein